MVLKVEEKLFIVSHLSCLFMSSFSKSRFLLVQLHFNQFLTRSQEHTPNTIVSYEHFFVKKKKKTLLLAKSCIQQLDPREVPSKLS